MGKRHIEALAIQERGFCNMSGIVVSLLSGCSEALSEDVLPSEDAACTLMVHRLAYLCKVVPFTEGLTLFSAAMEECRVKAAA